MKKINKEKIKEKTSNVKLKTKKVSKRKSWKNKSTFRKILLIILILFIACLLAGCAFFAVVITTAPEFKESNLYRTQSSILYDENGNEFARVGSENRQIIKYDQLSESLVDAIIATEDSRFFEHNGVDLPRFIIASVKQVLHLGGGGASTLTMQVSKNNFTSNVDSGIQGIIRKFQDVYISIFKIEKKYTKEEIIEFYVNSNYLGASSFGVETACQKYFQKSASELNIAEASLIAGIFNAPDAYDPIKNPVDSESRRETVLYLMKRHNYITQEEYDAAMKLDVEDILNVETSEEENEYLGFINAVVDDVIEKTKNDPYVVPMKIYTTMNREQQEYLDSLFNEKLGFKFKDEVVQSGVAVIDVEDGSVSSLGAGRNLTQKGFNYATDIDRQIGSTAKPLFVYGPAVEYNGYSTVTPIVDEPWHYSDNTTMTIKNSDGTNHGIVTVKQALNQSLNTCAVKTFQKVEKTNVYDFVTALGLHPEIEEGTKLVHEAHALGGYNGESPLSMAAAYAAFANGGYYIEPYTFTKIEYMDSNDTYTYKPVKKRAMSEETAYILMQLLISDANYYGDYANGVTFGSKTGTTNLDYKTTSQAGVPSSTTTDTWKMGVSGKYSIGTWYGYDELSSDYYMTPWTSQREELFRYVIRGIFKENKQFKQPSGVIKVEVETDNTELLLPSEYTPSNLRTTGYFVKGTEPTTVSKRFSKLENVTNLTAESSNGETSLSWTAIKTPDAISSTYLTEYYTKAFTNETTRQTYLNQRLSYNSGNIGTIVYKIYSKDGETYNYIGQTQDTTYKTDSLDGTNTYVVKSSYSIFSANASSGATVDVTATSSNISISLTSQSIYTQLGIKPDYKALVKITKDGVNVDNSNATIVVNDSEVNYNVKGSYTVSYTVTYKSKVKTFNLNLTIQ